MSAMIGHRHLVTGLVLLLLGGGLFPSERAAAKTQSRPDGPTPPPAAPPETTRDQRTAEAARRLRDAIEASAQTHKLGAGTAALVDELAKAGIDVVRILSEELGRPTHGRTTRVGRNTVIFQALEKIASKEAKAALLEAALRPGIDSLTIGPRAAKSYVALSADSTEIALLVESTEPEVRDVAAQSLTGKSLTAPAVAALGRLIEGRSAVTHNLVAIAFGSDPSAETAPTKVDLLLRAARGISELEGGEVDLEVGFTRREIVFGSRVAALARMPGAEGALLERRTKTTGEPAKTMLALALARRGRREARDDVLAIIRSEKDGYVRMLAVESLAAVATPEDVPSLEELAKNDPFEREARHHRPAERLFPVREAARRVIAELRKPK